MPIELDMMCPVCPGKKLVMAERSGVEIDYCPQCRGIWLDRGELDKILERAHHETSRQPATPPPPPQPTHHQPTHHAPPPPPAYYPPPPHYDKKYYKKRKPWWIDIFD